MKRALKPEKWSVFFRQTLIEMDTLCIDSLGIIAIISLFMGAVIVIQTAYNMTAPWIPKFDIGFTVKESLVLEFLSYHDKLNTCRKGWLKNSF